MDVKHREASIFLNSSLAAVADFFRHHNVQKRIRRVPAKDIHRLFSPAAVPRRLLYGQQAIRLRALQRILLQAEDRLPRASGLVTFHAIYSPPAHS